MRQPTIQHWRVEFINIASPTVTLIVNQVATSREDAITKARKTLAETFDAWELNTAITFVEFNYNGPG